MVDAGVDEAHCDTILDRSLKGMDSHYVKPPEGYLTAAMDKYTEWLDGQIEAKLQNIDHSVDRAVFSNRN